MKTQTHYEKEGDVLGARCPKPAARPIQHAATIPAHDVTPGACLKSYKIYGSVTDITYVTHPV